MDEGIKCRLVNLILNTKRLKEVEDIKVGILDLKRKLVGIYI
jgi:hypothetical protein